MTKPIVLIHGAWHGGWCFDQVAAPLRVFGFEVHAPDLPLTGAEDDVAAARSLVASLPGAVVLGHSYGGVVITHACRDLDVSRLVYLCAFMPDRGEDLAALRAAAPPTPALEGAMVVDEQGLRIDPQRGPAAFYHDCPENLVTAAVARLRPMPGAVLPVLDKAPAWSEVPSTYVVCTDDRAIHRDQQRSFALRATDVVEWPTAHSPFFACPERLVDLLADYAA